ncbi:unnamed protein product [Discula destructiva]
MQLTNGLYLISTIATNPWGERWVQRNTAEDRTLIPKPVAVQPADAVPFQWTVEQDTSGEDQYFLYANHGTGSSAAGSIDEGGKVSAALADDTPAQAWIVQQCQRCDEGVFVVLDGESGAFWLTPDPRRKSPQILVQNVILPLIYPPIYPPTVLFNFTQILV